MTHSPHNAENAGGARKAFCAHVLKAVEEYRDAKINAMGLVAEVLAATREYHRKVGAR